jgi:hypothetical protein
MSLETRVTCASLAHPLLVVATHVVVDGGHAQEAVYGLGATLQPLPGHGGLDPASARGAGAPAGPEPEPGEHGDEEEQHSPRPGAGRQQLQAAPSGPGTLARNDGRIAAMPEAGPWLMWCWLVGGNWLLLPGNCRCV